MFRKCSRRKIEISHGGAIVFASGISGISAVGPLIEDRSVDMGILLFGLAATSSRIACSPGITTEAHPPSTPFELQKHPCRIQSNSSGTSASAAVQQQRAKLAS